MLKSRKPIATFLCAILMAFTPLFGPAAQAEIIDDFNSGTAPNPAIWEEKGFLGFLGSTTVSGGYLVFDGSVENWGIEEVATITNYYLPGPGVTTTVTWVMGPATIGTTNAAGDSSIRLQLAIVSSSQVGQSFQHFGNTEGGIWLDINNVGLTNTSGVGTQLRYANDTKLPNEDATFLADYDVTGWAWQSTDRTFSVELTDVGYTWFDGGTPIATSTWAVAGIEAGAEFINGFRIDALYQNNDTGRGGGSVNRVEIENPIVSDIIVSLTANPNPLLGGLGITLDFEVDPAATVSFDQGIGPVGQVAGIGSVTVDTPPVSVTSNIIYTMTATTGVVDETRSATVTLTPPVTGLKLPSFDDHFLGSALDTNFWERNSTPVTHTVDVSFISFDGETGGNWAPGEIHTLDVFRIPGPGESTEYTFELGPAAVTTTNAAGFEFRYSLGIVSADEPPNDWSLEVWQNDRGGVWYEIEFEDGVTNSAGGTVWWADETKVADSMDNAVDLPFAQLQPWNWKVDNHTVTLRLTDVGFFWYDGSNLLAAASWDPLAGEMLNGYRLMAAGVNYDTGRALTSIDRISASSVSTDFDFTSIVEGASVTVAWGPIYTNGTYNVDRSADLAGGSWDNLVTDLGTNVFTDASATSNSAFYRVSLNLPPSCGLLGAGFEAGEDLSGWTQVDYAGGSSAWEVGTPTATNGPAGAFAGSNVYGTDLDADYAPGSEVGLRTPVIDLTGLTSATMTFFHWYNVEQDFDFAELWLLNSSGTPLIAAPIQDFTGVSAEWEFFLLALPPEAFAAGQIMLEFRLFDADVFLEFPGWFIDEVCIEGE